MTILFAGLDHLGPLRRAGGTRDPDPVIAAALAELAGAGGLSLSIGRERDGMQDRDLRLLRETTRAILNVCLPPVDEAVKLVLGVRPDLATLTPEEREGFGAERGLDVEDRGPELAPIIEMLKSGGVAVSVLVDPAPAQVKAAHRAGAAAVLLHTGRYGWAGDAETRAAELERLVNAAKIGHRLGLAVHAGGGLGYLSVGQLAGVPEIEAVHVGHSLVARATLVGMSEAVRELLRALQSAGGR
jgi:pyridoxine 5-phosphate synthase